MDLSANPQPRTGIASSAAPVRGPSPVEGAFSVGEGAAIHPDRRDDSVIEAAIAEVIRADAVTAVRWSAHDVDDVD